MSILAVKNIPIKYDNLRDVLADESMNLYMEGSTTLTAYMAVSFFFPFYEKMKLNSLTFIVTLYKTYIDAYINSRIRYQNWFLFDSMTNIVAQS